MSFAGILLVTGVVIGVGMWRGSWGTLPMTDQQISTGLRAEDPKLLERSLGAVGERMRLNRPAERWFADVVSLSKHGDQQVRARAAWVMGLTTSRDDFRAALLSMLNDDARDVRGQAGVSLAANGSRAGHAQIVEMLRPLKVPAPTSGEVVHTRRAGDVQFGTVILGLRSGSSTTEVRSPIAGVIGKVLVANGDAVSAGVPVAVMYPSPEHAWSALHALETIGELPDLDVVKPYQGELPGMPQNVVDEAYAAERAIHQHSNM
ncbi:MAG TPA: biotin/lipoyl-containing protein [Gemmatimonadaceae bacterium]|nr:biotin/lipoyl-containing protein [Gemmatimonadaceae bacterium]